MREGSPTVLHPDPPAERVADLLLVGSTAARAPLALVTQSRAEGWSTLALGAEREALEGPELFAMIAGRKEPVEVTEPAPSGQHPSATSARLPAMAFGQQSGPPASTRQVRELLALLNDAGHTDFRDARGPMGFTQRQAAGKFTRDEAAAFIARLQGNELGGTPPAVVPAAKLSAEEQLLRHLPAEQLAAELSLGTPPSDRVVGRPSV